MTEMSFIIAIQQHPTLDGTYILIGDRIESIEKMRREHHIFDDVEGGIKDMYYLGSNALCSSTKEELKRTAKIAGLKLYHITSDKIINHITKPTKTKKKRK